MLRNEVLQQGGGGGQSAVGGRPAFGVDSNRNPINTCTQHCLWHEEFQDPVSNTAFLPKIILTQLANRRSLKPEVWMLDRY